MKWTYDWLKQYLKTDLPAAQIAETLTRTGLEVEGLSAPAPFVAARIIECRPHENSDHLHVLKVDDGTGAPRQVVCGAPNARAGLVSVLARPGCIVGGREIQSGKLRGVVSDGMMCSAREIGIGDDDDGIIELDADTAPGMTVVAPPVVFDAGITPNRPDYLAVRGVARDLAAAGAGEYLDAPVKQLDAKSGARTVRVETPLCGVYRFCEIHGIKMGPGDKTISTRLAAIGINPKNAPVDATNYVCYDMGQPMHCFDADKVCGDIVVRTARDGEEFTDLFGAAHTLCASDVVIADDAGVLALAGVVGGARAAASDDTKNIILESAYFDPVAVRKTAKRVGMSTDASYRYERGIDPTMTASALAAATQIVLDACGGKIVAVECGGADDYSAPEIEYNPDLFRKKTGVSLDADVQRRILENLGYAVRCDGDKWIVVPRPARVDVRIAETVVADLLRIYGYDKIATSRQHTTGEVRPHDDADWRMRAMLAARGLNETHSFGFGNSALESVLSDKQSIKIANPITSELDTLRNSLLGNMLTAAANNEKRGYPDLAMFEIGTVFDGDAPGDQHTQLCILRMGAASPKHWQGRGRNVDIFDAKADLIALMRDRKFTVSDADAPLWAHPFRYGAIYQGKKKIAEFGQLHPAVAKKLRIKSDAVVAIVDDVSALPSRRAACAAPLSDFQPIKRDFAFIVDASMPAENLVDAARRADARISDAVVFDAFAMDDGTKSIAFTITIIPTENMSDGDLMKIQDAVISAVESKCAARIRDR